MTNRQIFERWVAQTLTVPVMPTARYDSRDGAYKDERMQIAWTAWKHGLRTGSALQRRGDDHG